MISSHIDRYRKEFLNGVLRQFGCDTHSVGIRKHSSLTLGEKSFDYTPSIGAKDFGEGLFLWLQQAGVTLAEPRFSTSSYTGTPDAFC